MGYLLIKCEHCGLDFDHWVVHRLTADRKRFCDRCKRARARNGGKKIMKIDRVSTGKEIAEADELKLRPCLGCGVEFKSLKSKRFCQKCTYNKNRKKKKGRAIQGSFYT